MLSEKFNPYITPSEYASLGYHAARFYGRHIGISLDQRIQGNRWYEEGSFMMTVLSHLSGKSLPGPVFPLVTDVVRYMTATDDLFDKSVATPTRDEWELATLKHRKTIARTIAKSGLPAGKQIDLRECIGQLENSAYEGLTMINQWTDDPTFAQAYQYRLMTSGLFSSGVAKLWDIAADTPEHRRRSTQNGTIHIGMIIQHWDDLSDIVKDKPKDGNLVLGLVNDQQIRFADLRTLIERCGSVYIYELLRSEVPTLLNSFMNSLNNEIGGLRSISPSLSRAMSGLSKHLLPKIVVSSDPNISGLPNTW